MNLEDLLNSQFIEALNYVENALGIRNYCIIGGFAIYSYLRLALEKGIIDKTKFRKLLQIVFPEGRKYETDLDIVVEEISENGREELRKKGFELMHPIERGCKLGTLKREYPQENPHMDIYSKRIKTSVKEMEIQIIDGKILSVLSPRIDIEYEEGQSAKLEIDGREINVLSLEYLITCYIPLTGGKDKKRLNRTLILISLLRLKYANPEEVVRMGYKIAGVLIKNSLNPPEMIGYLQKFLGYCEQRRKFIERKLSEGKDYIDAFLEGVKRKIAEYESVT